MIDSDNYSGPIPPITENDLKKLRHLQRVFEKERGKWLSAQVIAQQGGLGYYGCRSLQKLWQARLIHRQKNKGRIYYYIWSNLREADRDHVIASVPIFRLSKQRGRKRSS